MISFLTPTRVFLDLIHWYFTLSQGKKSLKVQKVAMKAHKGLNYSR